MVARHVTRCSTFSTIPLTGLWASIGVTHSYSSRLFLCILEYRWHQICEISLHNKCMVYRNSFAKRSLQQVYIGGLVWCQSCVALNCVWSHLEVADPQLPGIGQFHHGNKTAGKQPLNDAYLPSICSGSQDTQSLYHKVMWLSGGCYHDYQLYNRYVLNRVREQFHRSIHTEYEDGTDLAGGGLSLPFSKLGSSRSMEFRGKSL